MKTIMFYINQVYDGGSERVIVNLANHFAEIGYQSILVTSFKHTDEYPISDDVIRVITDDDNHRSRIGRMIRRITVLRKCCKQYKPDILIAFLLESIVRAIIATAFLPVKTIISVRNDPELDHSGFVRHFIGKVIYPCSDGCVFQTEYAKSWYPLKLQAKSAVIGNSIDDSFFAAPRNPIDGKIITCGRLSAVKNHKMLIKAITKLKSLHPGITLDIYGDGECKKELQDYISTKNATDYISLKGKTDNVSEILSHAEIFALSSDSEGLPNALMEAMAAGVPCVSTDCPCGGPALLIDNGNNGMLVEVGDSNEMAEAISELMNDKPKATQMGENARDRVKDYSREKIHSLWVDYVEQIAVGE